MKQVTLIAALDSCGGIGFNNKLPWRIPADLKYFKEKTVGETVIMGRKTYESIGKPLPNRHNIVLTRNWVDYYTDKGVSTASSIKEAILMAALDTSVFIIGGGEVYQEALPLANHMLLTHIKGDFNCDTFFPKFNPGEWNCWEQAEEVCGRSGLTYSFQTYMRKPGMVR